jgi:hypothetical protein
VFARTAVPAGAKRNDCRDGHEKCKPSEHAQKKQELKDKVTGRGTATFSPESADVALLRQNAIE